MKSILFLTPQDDCNASGENTSRADAFGDTPFFVFPHAAVVPYFVRGSTDWSQPWRAIIALVGGRLVCLGHRRFGYLLFDVKAGEHVQRGHDIEAHLHSSDVIFGDSRDELDSILKIRDGKVEIIADDVG